MPSIHTPTTPASAPNKGELQFTFIKQGWPATKGETQFTIPAPSAPRTPPSPGHTPDGGLARADKKPALFDQKRTFSTDAAKPPMAALPPLSPQGRQPNYQLPFTNHPSPLGISTPMRHISSIFHSF